MFRVQVILEDIPVPGTVFCLNFVVILGEVGQPHAIVGCSKDRPIFTEDNERTALVLGQVVIDIIVLVVAVVVVIAFVVAGDEPIFGIRYSGLQLLLHGALQRIGRPGVEHHHESRCEQCREDGIIQRNPRGKFHVIPPLS